MIILGLLMQMGGSQALAHSIEKLKVIVTISVGLNRASFMDCVVLKPGAEGEQKSYRVRWRATGDARVDMDSAAGAQALWISNETVSTMIPGPVWQPALEFLSPKIVAKNMEEQYGLMQSGGRSNAGTNEFLIVGREGRQDVEFVVDAKTYLPKVLKKYSHGSDRATGARNCVLEARFLWDQPVPAEFFSPQTPAAER
jgi:hypothetical protein